MIQTRLLRSTRFAACLAVAVFGLGVCGAASADEIMRNGQWQAATIIGVEDGQLVYRNNAGGQREVPLGQIESLRLDDDETFFEALEAFGEEDYRRAERMFEEIAEQARQDWVRQYAQYYLVQALDHRGEPTEAAEVFVALVRDGADPYFLAMPPVDSLAEANDDQRSRIREEVMDVIEDTEGQARARVQAYLLAVVGEEQMPDLGPGTDAPETPSTRDHSGSAVILPTVVWNLIDAEDADLDRWAAITLISEGKYEESIEALTPWLNNPADMPEKLFLLGRAQLAIAEASDDDGLYLDAGLTFMRIVVHYERLDSPLVAPARLEVAYIHRLIGREDLYEKILFNDNLVLSFADDPETYPQYYQRYYQIIGEPLPSETPDDEDAAGGGSDD